MPARWRTSPETDLTALVPVAWTVRIIVIIIRIELAVFAPGSVAWLTRQHLGQRRALFHAEFT